MISLARVPRRPDWPWWSVALVVGWGGLVATAVYLEQRTGHEVSLCLFRRITGLPCLTCGSTRAVLSLGAGDLAQALAHNPLVMLVLTLVALSLVLRLALGREIHLALPLLLRRLAWVLVFAAALANWAYLIATGR